MYQVAAWSLSLLQIHTSTDNSAPIKFILKTIQALKTYSVVPGYKLPSLLDQFNYLRHRDGVVFLGEPLVYKKEKSLILKYHKNVNKINLNKETLPNTLFSKPIFYLF